MHGVTTRLPRVSPREPLKYNDWVIPAGVSILLQHPSNLLVPSNINCRPQLASPTTLYIWILRSFQTLPSMIRNDGSKLIKKVSGLTDIWYHSQKEVDPVLE